MDVGLRFVCSKCRERKAASCFYPNKTTSRGYDYVCKECRKPGSADYYIRNRERILTEKAEWREYHPDRLDEKRHRLRKYGLSIEDHTRMLQEQNFCCAACGDTFDPERSNKRACVDHSHREGNVRSLICAECNLILGQVKDDIRRLEVLIMYLGGHK